MADNVEELFVHRVDVGVADVDLVTDDEVINLRAVVQWSVARDPKSGQERRVLMVYNPANVTAIIDALRAASERALDRSSS